MRADAVRNRAKVLDAARVLLRDHGVDVPLDAIARAAGVGPGTLHRHFPSKATLLLEVLLTDLDRRLADGWERLEQPDPGRALLETLHGLLDDARSNAALKSALGGEGSFDLATLRPDAAEALDRLLAALLAAAQDAEHVRRDLTVAGLRAILVGAAAAEALPSMPDEQRRGARDMVLDGLRPQPSRPDRAYTT